MPVVTPTQVFPGFSSDGTIITIPIADLVGLSAAEANPTTGNVMELIRIILERTDSTLSALTPAAKPSRASLVKAAPTIAFGTGVPPGTLSQAFTLTSSLTPTGLEPTAE